MVLLWEDSESPSEVLIGVSSLGSAPHASDSLPWLADDMELHTPSELYNPTDPLLSKLMSSSLLPNDHFSSSRWLPVGP